MEQSVSLRNSIIDTVSFEFISGVDKSLFKPHHTGWRLFPYAVIVCAFDAEYTCEIKGEGVYTINAGQALLVPGGLHHRMIFGKTGYLSCLHFNFTVFGGVDVLSLYDVRRVLKISERHHLSDMVDEICRNMSSGITPLKTLFRVKEVSFSLLNSIIENSREKPGIKGIMTGIEKLLPVLGYITQNIGSDISRKTLADIISLSETRFHYVFRETMHTSPMKYLREQRLQKAYAMIASTQMPIIEIASSVGYPDYSNFSKQFKAYFGETPLDARKRLGNDLSLVIP